MEKGEGSSGKQRKEEGEKGGREPHILTPPQLQYELVHKSVTGQYANISKGRHTYAIHTLYSVVCIVNTAQQY